MEGADVFQSEYKGTKDFNQQKVATANATGFGAAADDYAERGIDLNEQLVKNKAATYFMRVNSNAMAEAGIHKGDVVVIDRSLEVTNGKVVIAAINGELLIRYYNEEGGKVKLVPATKKLAPLNIDRFACEFFVWGVVTYVIHQV